MTEREICGSFRRAENQKQQIQILTELTCKSKYQIIGILLRNGEKVPKSIENQLYKRLDALDAQIFECEMEYKEIVTACGEITIDTIPRGATVIIDGETGFATMDGENKFKDV